MASRKTTKTRNKKSLADPTTLQPFQKKPEESTTGTAVPNEDLLQVIIETPKGNRNKYAFDPKQEIFLLKAALPAGMVFPYDFGFVPRTLADDGDPIDVLVLMDEPAFPGCALLTRLIAVAETAHMYANLKKLKDIPEQILKEIEQFFVNYHELQGKQFKPLARKGPKAAFALIAQARKNAR